MIKSSLIKKDIYEHDASIIALFFSNDSYRLSIILVITECVTDLD